MFVDTFDSPLGQIRLCSDGSFLTAVVFSGQKYEKNHIPLDVCFSTCSVLDETKVWLSAYFEGNVPAALPPMKPKGTPFQMTVWELLLQIPYGKTVTYADLAMRLGCKSAQAVGGAVGRNPIAILIPCHRVIGVGNKLTGYAGGIEKKEYLLALEKQHC